MIGIINRGPIPRASEINLETGEVTPTEPQVFSSAVTPTPRESEAQRVEQRYFESRRPRILQIDITALSSLRTSSDPEIAIGQREALAEVHAAQARAEAVSVRVIAREVEEMKVAHRELSKACRVALDALDPIRAEIGRGEEGFREAQRRTRDARLRWERSKTALRPHPTDDEREQWIKGMDTTQAKWEECLEAEQATSDHLAALEAKTVTANRKVQSAEAEYRKSQQRIDQLEGRVTKSERRSSYSGPSNGLGTQA
jgi:chromosome segregation ATPase